MVKSIASRTAQSADTADEMAELLVGRLDAFARVQSAVSRDPDSGIDLAGLVTDELMAHAATMGENLSVEGPSVLLKPKAAESISLAIHELATNAVKHGALRGEQGKVTINWRVDGDGDGTALCFDWTESVPTGGVAQGSREGFGMELLSRILPYDLDAKTKVDFRQHGIRFELEVPREHLFDRGSERATND